MLSQTVPQPQHAVYMTQANPVRDPISKASQNHPILFHRLGISQIILGIVAIVLGITLAVYANIYEARYPYPYYDDYWGRIAPGVWCGVFFFTTGLLGVLSARYKTRCLVVASLTLAIFSTLSAATLMGISIAGAVVSTEPYESRYHVWMVSSGIHSTQTVVAFVALVLSIIHAAYCCNCNGCESQESCCMPSVQPTESRVFVNNAAFLNQPQVNQSVPNANVQVRPLSASQVVQQPFVVTTGIPQQSPVYQVQQQVPQILYVQQTQPQQQQQQQQQPQQQQQQQQQPQQQQQQRQEKSNDQPPSYQKEEKF